MNPALLKAAGYRRVSMHEQVEGHSLDAQENNIRDYICSQGWSLVQIYTDPGISAKKDSHRPVFEILMQDARAGKFDVVVVDKIDRFYRHLGGLLTALDKLNSYNVGFASVQERLDFTTPWGKLTLTILGMLAEIYIDNLRQETRKGKRQRARKGLWNGSVPYGYCKGLCSECTDPNGLDYCPNYGQGDRSDGKILVAHPIEGEVVKMVFEWYASGETSDACIAEKLNQLTFSLENGKEVPLRQKGRPGLSSPGPFSRDSIRDMLQRVFYTGMVPYYGSTQSGSKKKRRDPVAIYPGKHPALVPETILKQVQELRSVLASHPRERNGKKHRVYPLSGLLYCGGCGSPMRGSASGTGKRYYRDASQIERTGKCRQPLAAADNIEQQVVNFLRIQLAEIDIAAIIQQRQLQQEQSQARYQRAQQLYLDGDINRDQYLAEKEQHEKLEKAWKITTPDETISSGDKLYKNLVEWNRILPTEKKRLLQGSVEAVFVREGALVGMQPSLAYHSLYRECCTSGDDGYRPLE